MTGHFVKMAERAELLAALDRTTEAVTRECVDAYADTMARICGGE